MENKLKPHRPKGPRPHVPDLRGIALAFTFGRFSTTNYCSREQRGLDHGNRYTPVQSVQYQCVRYCNTCYDTLYPEQD